jgi:tRNA threonylcarbamoyladenosine biosynthesis protein TsaE
MPKLSLNLPTREATIKTAQLIGSHLKGGEVIELVSDIGGGKTTFTKGLAEGAKTETTARSPSFVIEHQYRAHHLIIHHLDFYRLNEPGIMRQMVIEVLNNKTATLVVEWSDIIKDILPKDRLVVKFKVLSQTKRQLDLTYPTSYSYLMKDYKQTC